MEVASHTKDAILSAAAFADFQGEVAKQLHEGNQAGAEGLWLSAVEILHKPWFLAPYNEAQWPSAIAGCTMYGGAMYTM